MVNPFEGIAQGIVNLGKHFSSILDYLNPLSENFILLDVFKFFNSIINFLNPFSEEFFGYKLVEFIGDLLEELFIPNEDHFGDLNDKINSKFGFIGQVKELVYTLFNLNEEEGYESTPNWSVTYEGVTVDIIDWTPFEKYRSYFHGLVLSIMWISFLHRLYKRIPAIIYGFTEK